MDSFAWHASVALKRWAAYVFARSTGTANAAVKALDVGSVGVNELRGVPPDVGIGGIKGSGHGYEGGRLGIDAFLNLKVKRGRRGPILDDGHSVRSPITRAPLERRSPSERATRMRISSRAKRARRRSQDAVLHQ
ncbi:MAG: aldehyde dehydrogenase family protein [bacterium]